MVSVCPRHVKEGLDVLDVPHVYKIDQKSEEKKKTCKCEFCHLKADYKLDSYSSYQKKLPEQQK
ncbi:hypothetical protein [Alkalihalobacterium elongatum]|uniref:hypothetical protein n=1 Tax=Alkalihalobacterium elongatum TaxID=2675466 RepID=UPI001C1F2B20|nr:hypothetical protein [Alkalihalobacterium elongatum]